MHARKSYPLIHFVLLQKSPGDGWAWNNFVCSHVTPSSLALLEASPYISKGRSAVSAETCLTLSPKLLGEAGFGLGETVEIWPKKP